MMKKYLMFPLVFLLVLGVLLLAACNGDKGTETQTEQATEAHQHTPVTDPGKEATCTESGLTEGSHCSECGEVLIAQTVIPAKGHTPGDEADCTHDQTCTVCQVVLEAKLGHDYRATVTPRPARSRAIPLTPVPVAVTATRIVMSMRRDTSF